MDSPTASTFFFLEQYAHKDLFIEKKPVWNALQEISKYLKTKNLGVFSCDVPRGTFLDLRELISIGEGTVVEEGAYIRGPCIIGKNCVIRHGAYIRGNFICGDNCVIGHATEVKNSILLDNAHAAHFAYLGDTILGNYVNLGAGTKCANLKLDSKEVFFQGESTGLRKFGAVIGDRSQLGCNTVTNPGTLIAPDVLCYPCLNIGGFIPAGKTIKPSGKVIIS